MGWDDASRPVVVGPGPAAAAGTCLAGSPPAQPSNATVAMATEVQKLKLSGHEIADRNALLLARVLNHNMARQGWNTAFKVIAVGGWIGTAADLIATIAEPSGSDRTVGVVTTVISAVVAGIFTGVAVKIDNDSADQVEEAAAALGVIGAEPPVAKP
jgi:hypothetical protein